ncbi:MAG: BrnT family toxin [Elusimicrobiota bacterium]|jgi:uncharacterized DUF497 family protein|nr:BrnT family toxin [Elusimicrobiota bacterium]
MDYEWDENKRMSNLKKHGLDFADARMVFEDINSILIFDDRQDYGEERFRTIGKNKKELLTAVIHTDRNKKTRIISFRLATKLERRLYYGNS